MVERTVYDCDKCEAEAIDPPNELYVHTGQREQGYDGTEAQYVKIHLCVACLALAFKTLYIPSRRKEPIEHQNRTEALYKWVKK